MNERHKYKQARLSAFQPEDICKKSNIIPEDDNDVEQQMMPTCKDDKDYKLDKLNVPVWIISGWATCTASSTGDKHIFVPKFVENHSLGTPLVKKCLKVAHEMSQEQQEAGEEEQEEAGKEEQV